MPQFLMSRPAETANVGRVGAQPIALASAVLFLLVAGVASVAFWRAHGGSTEPDRAVQARLLQARAAQASEQLVEKTNGLAATQQESIDQLQAMQDQLQTMKRLLASQQAETRRLSEQVSTLTETVDGLRQSFASVSSDSSSAPAARNRSVRARAHAMAHHSHNGTRS